ncbi:MAG TPA: hypothetical protein VJZ50_05095 [Candidatus Limnocylindrales bacterium]|jgi:threonine dehydrogenase-like Zn-dependent dehydrogenase|nr:hypothetical protein [Candidatus Limnocylindrales bacterium]
MNAARTRSTLLTRVIETQRQAAASRYDDRRTHRRQVSFAERYRGTEFETLSTALVVREPHISRGRTFVLVTGAATIGLAGVIIAGSMG